MDKFPILELVVKIASRCNLNCSYCYEYNMGDDTWRRASKFMSSETARQLGRRIWEHVQEHQLPSFDIGFHGGEPLLMPAEKMDELVQSIKAAFPPAFPLHFGIQTNATLMSSAHIDVFKKNNIHISISLDGTEETNDKNRVDLKGGPSWKRVMAGIDLLRREAPELMIGILSVIDIDSDPIETFDFLAQFGVDIDFLLPLATFDKPPYYPPGKALGYGKWYFDIYSEWVKGRNDHISVRFLKNIIKQLMGGTAIYEVMTYNPIGLLTISTDGYMEGLDCLKSLGNRIQVTNLHIRDNSFNDALEHEIVKIRQMGIPALHKKCQSCDYLHGCAGGYFPNRFSEENGFDNPSVYCDDLYWLLQQIERDLKKRTENEHAPL
jgi:uncharacterized protein